VLKQQKAHSTLGMIRRTIVTRDKHTILKAIGHSWSILHPGMESIPEIGHGNTGKSAKKSYKNYLGLQGFEL